MSLRTVGSGSYRNMRSKVGTEKNAVVCYMWEKYSTCRHSGSPSWRHSRPTKIAFHTKIAVEESRNDDQLCSGGRLCLSAEYLEEA